MNNATTSLTHCFLRLPGSDRIIFTRSGREKFTKRFAVIGVNIEDVKTAKDLIRVHTRCLQHDLQRIIGETTDPALK